MEKPFRFVPKAARKAMPTLPTWNSPGWDLKVEKPQCKICDRNTYKLVCKTTGCDFTANRGRKKLACPDHPKVVFMSDFRACPICRNETLEEIKDKPAAIELQKKIEAAVAAEKTNKTEEVNQALELILKNCKLVDPFKAKILIDKLTLVSGLQVAASPSKSNGHTSPLSKFQDNSVSFPFEGSRIENTLPDPAKNMLKNSPLNLSGQQESERPERVAKLNAFLKELATREQEENLSFESSSDVLDGTQMPSISSVVEVQQPKNYLDTSQLRDALYNLELDDYKVDIALPPIKIPELNSPISFHPVVAKEEEKKEDIYKTPKKEIKSCVLCKLCHWTEDELGGEIPIKCSKCKTEQNYKHLVKVELTNKLCLQIVDQRN